MSKTYKTSQGKTIDFEKLMLQNEEVRAVGNMHVNARGDAIDSGNKQVSSRNKQVARQYKKQTAGQVRDLPVMNSKKAASIVAEKYAASIVNSGVNNEAEITGLDTEPTAEPVEQEVSVTEAVAEPQVVDAEPALTSGLAGAIAKARDVKQEPVKTPLEEERSVDGVKKI